MSGVLDGIKVLDLSRVLAGPFCTMMLGDMGAEIVKVEAPGGSDDTRKWGPPFQSTESAYYLCANRNKRAVTINLKTEQGQKIIKELVKDSDVVIHNFKNGTMKKLGFDYADLKEINQALIFCSITGFGSNGPYRDYPGYDYIIQAMSGLMSITGTEESGPMKTGVAISDILTGLYAAIGIIGALYEKEQSGSGQSLDISLYDSQVSALVNVASNYLVSGELPKRLGNEHPNIVPYQTFETNDGDMVIAIGNDGQFRRFCSVIGMEELAKDRRFSTNASRLENREILTPMIAVKMKSKNAAEWLALLQKEGIPCGPINNLEKLFEDEQVKARDMVVQVEHPKAGPVSLVGSPLKFSRTPVTINRHPPTAGEHTEEVLLEMGLETEYIKQLKKENII